MNVKRLVWTIGTVLLLAGCSASVSRSPPETPEQKAARQAKLLETGRDMWAEIERVVSAAVKESSTRNEKGPSFTDTPRSLAVRHGRPGIEALYLYWQETASSPQRPDARQPTENAVWADLLRSFLVSEVVAAIADPKREHDLHIGEKLHPYGGFGCISPPCFCVAAIDVYHDAAARDLLLDIATDDRSWGFRDRSDDISPILALGFLRRYEPSVVRPRLEAELPKVDALVKQARPVYYRKCPQDRANCLRAALSALKFAERLESPTERARFYDFEGRLWRGYALSGVNLHYGSEKAASRFVGAHWAKQDERFMLRIFVDEHATHYETQVACVLVQLLSAGGRERLDKFVSGDSPRAKFLRWQLGK